MKRENIKLPLILDTYFFERYVKIIHIKTNNFNFLKIITEMVKKLVKIV